jgi:hypothetical protein
MKVLTLSTKVSVTSLGKISPFGRNFFSIGRNFSREKNGCATVWAIFSQKNLVTLTLDESAHRGSEVSAAKSCCRTS